tara:strand:+ start:609 stop:1187 length:579 start_codon:yes stop_codon:yes gene_type:complete
MVWTKLGSTTLGSAGDLISVTGMTSSKFINILDHNIASGNIADYLTFNNDSTTKYAWRRSSNGLGDTTSTGQAYINLNEQGANDADFTVMQGSNISGEEKLFIHFMVNQGTAGAGTAPQRMEYVSKYVPSPDANITRTDLTNGSSGDFNTGSNVSVIGSDGVESLNVQDGAIYYSTDENKEFVLYNNAWTEL